MKTLFTFTLALAILLSSCTNRPIEPSEVSKDTEKSESSTREIKIVKYDGIAKTVQADAPDYEKIYTYYTELSPQIYEFYSGKTACISTAGTNFGGYPKFSDYDKDEKIFRKELKNKIDDANMDVFIDETKKIIKEKNARTLSHLCKAGADLYVTFWNDEYLYVALWDGEKFTTRETIGLGKSDKMDVFIPNYFGKNHLLGTSGDGYLTRWNFTEFDFDSGVINYIESCEALAESENKQGFVDTINVQCEMEYISPR